MKQNGEKEKCVNQNTHYLQSIFAMQDRCEGQIKMEEN